MAGPGSRHRFFIETFGCQMNVNDSEKIAGVLRAAGHEEVRSASSATFVFVNTCAVREKAAEKLYSALGRFRARKAADPEFVVGVGGCVAQLQGTAVSRRAPFIDILVGTHNFGRVAELLENAGPDRGRQIDLDRSATTFDVPHEHVAHGNPVRAYVTAMEGCNHVCSFCVVPRTRGTEVCRDPDDIVAEVRSLVSRGFPEVMLLGQTVNAYSRNGVDFVGLLERVAQVDGLQRLRFTTSHPEHVTPALADAFARLRVLCPYLHLPFQSGSDRVLASMRRGYSRSTYLETLALLRAAAPDLALTADAIVGYPGETGGEFEETVSLVESAGFEGLFVFTYSPRPGTTALRLADDVPAEEKARRLSVLNAMQQRIQARRNMERLGELEEVLAEKVEGPGRLYGRTRHFRIVHFDGDAELVGHTLRVEVTGATPNALLGRLAAPPPPQLPFAGRLHEG